MVALWVSVLFSSATYLNTIVWLGHLSPAQPFSKGPHLDTVWHVDIVRWLIYQDRTAGYIV